jgi:phospholipase/lecithinase/hemolysin
MFHHIRIFRWLFALFLSVPLVGFAATPVKSMVIFGDSMSDIGNTTRLLKSLRQEDDPAFIVEPFKAFVINKMVEFADDYHVPTMVLDSGIAVVTEFFDHNLAPYIANLVSKVKLVPLLPGEPYWKSRFSNGRVWSEYLARMISVNSKNKDLYLNRSFGGSWAATYDYQLTVWNVIRHPLLSIKNLIVGKLVPPSLGLSVQAHLMDNPKLSDETVFFIFAGGNDYMNVLSFDKNYNTEVMSAYIDNVLLGVGNSINKLAKAGARRFVVIGVPQLGEAPRNVQTGDREVLNAAVNVHNDRLKHLVSEWQALYRDSDFLYVDIGAYLNGILQHPEEYGFTNISEPCIDVKLPMYHAFAASPFANNYVLRYAQVLQYRDRHFAEGEANYHVCATPESYLFWDEIHPTTRAHAFFALEVCRAMQEHGYSVTCKKT